MHDGKALQSGTSHNFGDGFARAFGIQYTDKENTLQYVHQSSESQEPLHKNLHKGLTSEWFSPRLLLQLHELYAPPATEIP